MAQTGFLEVGGGRLYYEVEGDGHPLTLIHAGIANLRMWDDQVPAFAERCRHLAESVADGRFELIPGTAHMLNMEQPELFNRLVLDFLAEVEARAAVG